MKRKLPKFTDTSERLLFNGIVEHLPSEAGTIRLAEERKDVRFFGLLARAIKNYERRKKSQQKVSNSNV